eukprot:6491606-Amphidinium_carterae.3
MADKVSARKRYEDEQKQKQQDLRKKVVDKMCAMTPKDLWCKAVEQTVNKITNKPAADPKGYKVDYLAAAVSDELDKSEFVKDAPSDKPKGKGKSKGKGKGESKQIGPPRRGTDRSNKTSQQPKNDQSPAGAGGKGQGKAKGKNGKTKTNKRNQQPPTGGKGGAGEPKGSLPSKGKGKGKGKKTSKGKQ